MKTKQKKTVRFLWGLPGSGKTHYTKASAPADSYKPSTYAVDADRVGRGHGKYSPGYKTLEKELAEEIVGKMNGAHVQIVIVDGLLTTNATAEKWIEAVIKEAGNDFNVGFEIVWWTPHREACVHNDTGRRTESSFTQIQNMPFEEPSSELIKKYKIGVTRLEVICKPMHRVWAGINDLGDQDTLESSTWCLGGTWGDYNGHTGTVSPSPQPANFEEFDQLLTKLCPGITFLQYKKLYGACVTIKESSESSYYGGTTNYARYVCDLAKLYNGLKDLEVIS